MLTTIKSNIVNSSIHHCYWSQNKTKNRPVPNHQRRPQEGEKNTKVKAIVTKAKKSHIKI
jgi:hypothetical protein